MATTAIRPIEYKLAPVSGSSFLFAKVDSEGNFLQPVPQPQTIATLNYAGLYKLLFLLKKVNPVDFGDALNAFNDLPVIDLTNKLQIPEAFQRQITQAELSAKLHTFFKAWYDASLVARNVGNLKGVQQWRDRTSVRPNPNATLIQDATSITLGDRLTHKQETQKFENLIQRVRDLAEEIRSCANDDCKIKAAGKIHSLLKSE